jgi:hypothetical protein
MAAYCEMMNMSASSSSSSDMPPMNVTDIGRHGVRRGDDDDDDAADDDVNNAYDDRMPAMQIR